MKLRLLTYVTNVIKRIHMWLLRRAAKQAAPRLAEWVPEWSIELAPPVPLKAIELDTTFNKPQKIDIEKEVAWGIQPGDVN